MKTAEVLLVARARRLASSGEGRAIREASGLSVGEIANAIGVSVTTAWRWEHGERAPRGERGAAWAALLLELEKAAA